MYVMSTKFGMNLELRYLQGVINDHKWFRHKIHEIKKLPENLRAVLFIFFGA